MAFRMRDAQGGDVLGGRHAPRRRAVRAAPSRSARFEFVPLRLWRSPRTGARYPVAWRVELPDLTSRSSRSWTTRRTTRGVGGNGVLGRRGDCARIDGKPVGRGYLELTGYWQTLRL